MLCVGARWCAVGTDLNYVRIFSTDGGMQLFVLCVGTPLVAMAAHENFLVILTHNGVPVIGSQNIRMRVIDVDYNYQTIFDTDLPLSPQSTLTWLGFSEEGQISSYDSDGILRTF